MRVLVILPTYNEAGNIISLLDRIAYVRGMVPFDLDVLVIDDNSPDGTARLAMEYSDSNEWVYVRVRSGKLGLASAIYMGLKYAYLNGYDYALTMDADMQHDPIFIPRLVRYALGGYDLVIGSRYIAGGGMLGWGIARRITSMVANIYARYMLCMKVRDLTSGYKCYGRRAMARILATGISSRGYAVQPETVYIAKRGGLRIGEAPFVFVNRRVGRSKMGLRVIAEFLLAIPRFLLFG